MGLQSLGASMCQNTAFDAGWYCRSPVNNVRRQLRACTRRAISLLQNKGILRDDNCSPSLPSYPYSRNTNARLRTTLQKFALHRFFSIFFTFRKAIFVRRSRYETREIALVLRWTERTVRMESARRIVLSAGERLLSALLPFLPSIMDVWIIKYVSFCITHACTILYC